MTFKPPERLIDDQFHALVDGLEVATDEQSIRLLLDQLAKSSGFEMFAFSHLNGGSTRLYSNYPNDWQRRYLDNNYASVDPVVAGGKREFVPFSWSAADMAKAGGEIKRIAKEADEFGIRSGFSIPIRTGFGGVALLTLASDRSQASPTALRDTAFGATAVAIVHLTLRRCCESIFASPSIALSPREATCLAWASLGKTKAETAVVVGLSERTVRFYLDRSMAKLNASNVTHAVRLAVERRLI